MNRNGLYVVIAVLLIYWFPDIVTWLPRQMAATPQVR